MGRPILRCSWGQQWCGGWLSISRIQHYSACRCTALCGSHTLHSIAACEPSPTPHCECLVLASWGCLFITQACRSASCLTQGRLPPLMSWWYCCKALGLQPGWCLTLCHTWQQNGQTLTSELSQLHKRKAHGIVHLGSQELKRPVSSACSLLLEFHSRVGAGRWTVDVSAVAGRDTGIAGC